MKFNLRENAKVVAESLILDLEAHEKDPRKKCNLDIHAFVDARIFTIINFRKLEGFGRIADYIKDMANWLDEYFSCCENTSYDWRHECRNICVEYEAPGHTSEFLLGSALEYIEDITNYTTSISWDTENTGLVYQMFGILWNCIAELIVDGLVSCDYDYLYLTPSILDADGKGKPSNARFWFISTYNKTRIELVKMLDDNEAVLANTYLEVAND